jgi:hypothetical protein
MQYGSEASALTALQRAFLAIMLVERDALVRKA